MLQVFELKAILLGEGFVRNGSYEVILVFFPFSIPVYIVIFGEELKIGTEMRLSSSLVQT